MELLGLIDALEAQVMQGHKIPWTGKILVDDEKIIDLLDKIRLVIRSGPDMVKNSLSRGADTRSHQANTIRAAQQLAQETSLSQAEVQKKAAEIINNAYEVAEEIQSGARKYADEVLANLLVISTRLQRNIESGRQRLAKTMGIDQPAAERPAEPSTPGAAPVRIPAFAEDAKNEGATVSVDAGRLHKYQAGGKKIVDDLEL